MKVVFTPISLALGLAAGFAGATGTWPGEEAPERE
jgi:hypothetical protein